MNALSSRTFAACLLAVACAIGLGVLVAAFVWPLPEPAADDNVVRVPATRPAGDLPLASFAPAWGVDLRKSLTDSPQAAAGTPNASNGSSVRLVGTIVDASRPRGIFVTTFGQMELRGVGEKAGGAEVLSIDERSATLMLAGRAVTLKVEKLEGPTPPLGEPVQPSADAGGTRTR